MREREDAEGEGGLGFQPQREGSGGFNPGNTHGHPARATSGASPGEIGDRPVRKIPSPETEEGRRLQAEYARLGIAHEPGADFVVELAAAGSDWESVRGGSGESDGIDTLRQDARATSGAAHGRAARGAKDVGYDQYLLRLPMSERPVCPFEETEYQSVVTDVQLRTCARESNPMGLHVAHTVAMLSVMASRAMRALQQKPLTDKYEQSGENSFTTFERPSAALVALEKLSGELRRWHQHVERSYSIYATADPAAIEEHRRRRTWDTNHDPDAAYVEPEFSAPVDAAHRDGGHHRDAARPGGATRDAYEARARGDSLWAGFEALNDLLDRADRAEGRGKRDKPNGPPHIQPGDPPDHGAGP